MRRGNRTTSSLRVTCLGEDPASPILLHTNILPYPDGCPYQNTQYLTQLHGRLLGSITVTVPGLYFLWGQRPQKTAHHDHHGDDHHAESHEPAAESTEHKDAPAPAPAAKSTEQKEGQSPAADAEKKVTSESTPVSIHPSPLNDSYTNLP